MQLESHSPVCRAVASYHLPWEGVWVARPVTGTEDRLWASLGGNTEGGEGHIKSLWAT